MKLGSLVGGSATVIGREATVAEAAEALITDGVGSLAVVEGRRLVGIFTERDVVRAVSEGADPEDEVVADWMSDDPGHLRPRRRGARGGGLAPRDGLPAHAGDAGRGTARHREHPRHPLGDHLRRGVSRGRGDPARWGSRGGCCAAAKAVRRVWSGRPWWWCWRASDPSPSGRTQVPQSRRSRGSMGPGFGPCHGRADRGLAGWPRSHHSRTGLHRPTLNRRGNELAKGRAAVGDVGRFAGHVEGVLAYEDAERGQEQPEGQSCGPGTDRHQCPTPKPCDPPDESSRVDWALGGPHFLTIQRNAPWRALNAPG